MIRDLPVKHRLVLGFGGVLVLMALVAFSAGSQFESTHKSAGVITEEMIPRVEIANNLAIAVDEQSTALRGYILTGEQKFHDDYRQAVGDEQTALRGLNSDADSDIEVPALAEISSLTTQMHQDALEIFRLVNAERTEAAFAYHQEHVRPAAANVVRLANRLSAAGLSRIGNAADSLSSSMDRLHDNALLSLGVALLFALVFVVATVRSITRPSRRISQAADAVTRGNYDPAINLRRQFSRSQGGETAEPKSELSRIAFALARMADTLQRREHILAAHADIGSACSSEIDVESLMDVALESLARQTRSQLAVAYVSQGGNLTVTGAYGISDEVAGTAITGPDGLVQQAAESGQPIIVDDISEDTRFLIQPGLGKIIPTSIACIPMMVEGKCLGVIVLASLHEYDRDTQGLMKTAAAQVGIALSNAMQHRNIIELADELRASNEQLDAQNEELQCQNEEIQAQNEEIHTQNEELSTQRADLLERNQELEMLTRDLSALQSITAIALSSLDQEELLRKLLDSVMAAQSLDCGVILLADKAEGVLRPAVVSSNLLEHEDLLEVRIGEGFAGQIAESKQPVFTDDAQTDPRVHIVLRQAGVRALVGVPLVIGDHLFGVALLGVSGSREFTDREKQLLRVFADRAAMALDRAHAFERVQAAEARARADQHRLQKTIDSMREGVIIATAPEGRVYMANKAALVLYGLDSIPDADISEYAHRFRLFGPNGETIAGEDLPLSRSILKGEICEGDEIVIRREDGTEVTVLCNTAPILDEQGCVTGAVGVFRDISTIKERQRLLQQTYEEQRNIAETLQKSFLPDSPIVAGYDIHQSYNAAQEHAQVGGDFYDVIELDGGLMGVVIGDVSGKGVEASIHTAMAKFMLRGFAHENPDPAVVLRRLNDAITRYIHGELFITMFYGLLHTEDKRLVYTNAGHEYPILVKQATGECIALETTGPAVGVIPESEYERREIQLDDGDAFVLYTDGITEARRDKEFLGLEGLTRMLSEIGPSSAKDITTHICSGAREFAGGRLNDDAAVLVVKLNK